MPGDDGSVGGRHPKKSTAMAYMLWLTCGLLGGHHVYLERSGQGMCCILEASAVAGWHAKALRIYAAWAAYECVTWCWGGEREQVLFCWDLCAVWQGLAPLEWLYHDGVSSTT